MYDEKTLIEAVLEAGRRAEIIPMRVIVKVEQITKVAVKNGTVEKEGTEQDYWVDVAGLIAGQLVQCESQTWNEDSPRAIVDALLQAPRREYKDSWFTKSGARLGKADTYSAKLAEIPPDVVTKSALKVCRALQDSLPENGIATAFACHTDGHVTLASSDGLYLTYKENAYQVGGKVAIAGTDGQTYEAADAKTFYKNLDTLDETAIGAQIAAQALAKVKAQPAKPGIYPAVLAPKVAAGLLAAAISHLDGQCLFGHKSVYDGQIGKDVFSEQLTVLNDPFVASGKARPFDGEGTPTEKFMAVDHGRLRCYLLDNEYGEKLQQKSNGCHTREGCDSQYLVVTPSDLSAQRLIGEIREGLLITELPDLNGLNLDTLAFSLRFYGFAIHGGIKSEAIVGVIQGQVDELLKNIVRISREREDRSGCLCPWFTVEKLNVA